MSSTQVGRRPSRGAWFAFAVLGLAFSAALARAANFIPDPALSKVEVAVHATADSFTATLDKYEASLKVDPEGRPTTGTFAWNFKDLNTGNTRRDKEMLHWLDHDKTPDAVFTFGKLSTNQGTLLAMGSLQMHGTTNQLAVPIRITRQDSDLAWEGDLELDHRPYNLPKIVKFAILRVDPVLKVHFKLQGKIKE